MKKIATFLLSGMLLGSALLPIHVNTAFAGDPPDFDEGGELQDVNISTESNLEKMIVSIINAVLVLLGTIFLILIIWSGFSWLLSAGNADKIGEAKGRIVAAVFGLAIVLAAYGIAAYTYDILTKATTNTQ